MGTELYKSLSTPPPRYVDRKYAGGPQKYFADLDKSTTLYVGNLSFYTSEEQIYELFSTVGNVKRVIMGLDKAQRTPCGFAFVEYYDRVAAEACMKYINGTMLDERLVRTDLDPGFSVERQFGRGVSGGQVRDEYRSDFDAGRGGYGRQVQRQQPEAYTEFGATAAASTAAPPTLAAAASSSSALPPQQLQQQAPLAGQKRTRDDGATTLPPPPTAFPTAAADGAEHKSKNPRFREANDDDDDEAADE